MTDIGLMVRSANPVPDGSQALTDDELSAVLLLAQQRSGDMDLKELTKPVERERTRRRSGLLVAVGAFVAVVIAIAGVVLLNRPNDEVPPATTPSTTIAEVAPSTTIAEVAPTTTVAGLPDDVLTPEEEVFVAEFIEAFNARDAVSVTGLVAADADITSYIVFEAAPSVWLDELNWRWALGEEWAVDECKLSFSAIDCDVIISGGLFGFLGPQDASLRLLTDEGVASSVTLRENLAVLIPAGTEFYAWVESEHPDKLEEIAGFGEPRPPLVTEEAIATWLVLLPEYEAHLAAG